MNTRTGESIEPGKGDSHSSQSDGEMRHEFFARCQLRYATHRLAPSGGSRTLSAFSAPRKRSELSDSLWATFDGSLDRRNNSWRQMGSGSCQRSRTGRSFGTIDCVSCSSEGSLDDPASRLGGPTSVAVRRQFVTILFNAPVRRSQKRQVLLQKCRVFIFRRARVGERGYT
jgi:hypothetical protein